LRRRQTPWPWLHGSDRASRVRLTTSRTWLRWGDDDIGSEQQLNEIVVSDRGTLRGLTQFRLRSLSTRPQTAEYKSHRRTGVFEGAFCDRLFKTARNLLILNGEMSEWSIEHAWKAISVRLTSNTETHHRLINWTTCRSEMLLDLTP
jgi:hypothetical protein